MSKTINRFVNASGARIGGDLKKGMKFVVETILEDACGVEYVRVGDELTLVEDDASRSPLFRVERLAKAKKRSAIYVDLRMLREVEEPAAKQFRVKHRRGWSEVPVKKGDIVTLIRKSEFSNNHLVTVQDGSSNPAGDGGWWIGGDCLEEIVETSAPAEAPKVQTAGDYPVGTKFRVTKDDAEYADVRRGDIVELRSQYASTSSEYFDPKVGFCWSFSSESVEPIVEETAPAEPDKSRFLVGGKGTTRISGLSIQPGARFRLKENSMGVPAGSVLVAVWDDGSYCPEFRLEDPSLWAASRYGYGGRGYYESLALLEEIVETPAQPALEPRIKTGAHVITLTDASETGGITLGKPYEVTCGGDAYIQFRDDGGEYRLRKAEFYEVVDPAHFEGWKMGEKVRFTSEQRMSSDGRKHVTISTGAEGFIFSGGGHRDVVRPISGFSGDPANTFTPGWYTHGYEKIVEPAPQPTIKAGDWISTEEDAGFDITAGKAYMVTHLSTDYDGSVSVHFEDDDGARRYRPAERYKVVPSPTEARPFQVGDRVREKATYKLGVVVKDDKSDCLPFRVKFDADAGEDVEEEFEWFGPRALELVVEETAPASLMVNPVEVVMVPDAIFAPSHYARFAIQPKDFITQNRLTYNVGTVVSYLCRFDAKNGLEDLLKAREHLDYLIEAERGAPGSQKAMAA